MSKERTPLRPAPEPLEANDVMTVTVGTVIWFALFVVQLPFYGWYSDHGHTWWIWTCLTGAGLGLIGLVYVRARRDAIARGAADAAQAGESGSQGHQGPQGPREEASQGPSAG